MRIVGVDVGSVTQNNFAWAALDDGQPAALPWGRMPEGAAAAVVHALHAGTPVVLVLEAPCCVPVPGPDHQQRLGAARTGEGNRPWSAGAGSGSLATGLAQGAWLLREIARSAPDTTATTSPQRWRAGHAELLLMEAFISGKGKNPPGPDGQHIRDAQDAAHAAHTLLDHGSDPLSTICCPDTDGATAFNLLAAMALHAGLTTDPDELRNDVLVARIQH